MDRFGRKGWHDRRGAERMFWCDRCAVPLLGDACGRCGGPGRHVPLSPPGDIRPAMRDGRKLVGGLLGRMFDLPPSSALFSGIIIFNRISGLDRTEQLFIDGSNVGTLAFDPRSRGYAFSPNAAGASMLLAAGARRLELAGPPPRGHIKGKSVPLSAFKPDGRALKEGEEVLVAGRGLAAAGRVQKGAIRIRDIGPDNVRPSGLNATIEDAVEANRRYLGMLEDRAVREIRSVAALKPGLPMTVSFSGGKDSLAALEIAGRAGRVDAVLFANTGLEYPETVEHIRTLARQRRLRLLEKEAGDSFWENLPRFGLPAKDFRWCCKVCKLAPMTELLKEHYPGGVLTVEGRRRRESFARQRIRLVEESPFVPGQLNIEPIRDWTALEVWLYIRWRNLAYNPLYDLDLERIGCWLCPSSLESEFEGLARTHPALHDRWANVLRKEGEKQGMDSRAVSLGAWRWKALPPKMKELLSFAGIAISPRREEGRAGLEIAGGISPCLTGGYSVEAMLKLPVPVSLGRTANLLQMLGDVRYSEDMGVLLLKKGEMSAKLFESGQVVVTWPSPESVREFLRDIVGLVMRGSMCSRCGICVRSCPRKALSLDAESLPELDASKCSHCMKCQKSCVLVHYADKMVGERGSRQ